MSVYISSCDLTTLPAAETRTRKESLAFIADVWNWRRLEYVGDYVCNGNTPSFVNRFGYMGALAATGIAENLRLLRALGLEVITVRVDKKAIRHSVKYCPTTYFIQQIEKHIESQIDHCSVTKSPVYYAHSRVFKSTGRSNDGALGPVACILTHSNTAQNATYISTITWSTYGHMPGRIYERVLARPAISESRW